MYNAGSKRGVGSSGNRPTGKHHLHRPSSARPVITRPAPPSSGTDERMSLVRGKASLSFGMIVKLTPDLVDEIKKAEDSGQPAARIKFATIPNNPEGNVIDVGGKIFRFTWAREVGDLCDIYEERQSSEDGDGLLVESGCAWRKLNVQRVLDESTTNHVKKRSEEAERQQKSRKAIILDNKNPSMKTQMKALAASETTSWRKSFPPKKEPEFKKRKIDPPPVASGGPAKSAYKSGFPSTTPITSKASISPSPPQYSGAPASPFFTGSMAKGHMSAEDLVSNQPVTKENVITSEKEKFNKTTSSVVQEKYRRKGNFVAKSMDLQSTLITLLKENPKGMSLKALEKAVGDSVPNSVKTIEPIIRKIATFRAPGRYILNPGVELGNLKKPLSESGSSPDDNGLQTPVVEEKHEDRSTPPNDRSTPLNFTPKVSTMELEKQALLNLNLGEEMNFFDNVDIQSHSPDAYGEKNISNNNEGPACSSSNNGSESESESDSSDSGSDGGSKVRSRSKSNSPVKSGSVSSSDSDSDASSNSKQGPDEDVDIMTSDDEESKPKRQIHEPKFAVSPIPFRAFDTSPTQNEFEEKQNFNGSDMIEIEQDVPDDVDTHAGNMFSERENVANDVSKPDWSRIPERTSKSKSKRGSDSKPPHEKSGHSKRLKPGNLPQPQLSRPMDSILSESPQTLFGNRIVEEAHKGRSSQVTNRALKDGSSDSGFQKGDNQGLSGKFSMDYQNSEQRPSDPSRRARPFGTAEKSDILPESLDFGKSQERLPLQKDRVKDDMRYNKEKLRTSKESSFGEKTHVGVVRGKMLQRELSDLELGEFREPLPEQKVGEKRLEKKNSFKEIENRPSPSDYWNSDLNKGRPTFRTGVLNNVEGPPKRTPDNQTEDIARPPNRVLQSQPKASLPPSRAADRAEVSSRKSGDTSGKIRQNETREDQENGVGGIGDVNKNVSMSVSKQNDVERGPVSHPKWESKTQKISSLPDPGEVHKGASLTESSEGVMKRRESSSDENSCPFSKYEKEEPELKGPVKDFSQYKEYVQEYREKYDSYCSLNKTLESDRNEFCKLGKDLENAEGRDEKKYYQILVQLQESYCQRGNRHKRLKKIFIVLHEELKHLKQAIKDYAASYAR